MHGFAVEVWLPSARQYPVVEHAVHHDAVAAINEVLYVPMGQGVSADAPKGQ